MDDDEIDSETLQAQFDLSMSMIHSLASSWVNSDKLPKSSHVDTEKELQDYMRRPPRLGVGAPIPESAITSRDSERLKQRLKIGGPGNKQQKIDGASDKPEHVDDDASDEDESRAHVIHKKAKVDPFSEKKRKKKNGQAVNVPVFAKSGTSDSPGIHSAAKVQVQTPGPVLPPESPGPSRKKQRRIHSPEVPASEGDMTLSIETANGAQDTTPKTNLSPSSGISKSPVSSPTSNIPIISPHSVLNLSGPPKEDEAVTPKKKKRKRKKKKNNPASHDAQGGLAGQSAELP